MNFDEAGYWIEPPTSATLRLTEYASSIAKGLVQDKTQANWTLPDGSFKHWMNPHTLPVFKALIECDQIQGLLRKPYTLTHSKVSYKVAGKPHFWRRHQDAGYKPFLEDGLTVGIMLDPVIKQNGAICVWAGSHKLGLRPHTRIHTTDENMDQAEIIDCPSGAATPIEGPLGTVFIMHPLCVHESGPNTLHGCRPIFLFEVTY